MKLSAAFNFFDCGELLVPALRSMRPHVHHLSIVVQEVSNYGNPVSEVSRAALKEAVALGLVDTVRHYQPDLSVSGGSNEFRKRALGVGCALEAGADHILLCDVDEFYEPAPMEAAKRFITQQRVDFSTVRSLAYYGRPTWRLLTGEHHRSLDLHVPFICRLTDQTVHVLGGSYPVEPVDPTRRILVAGGRHHFFEAHDIVMHHMTGVRWDVQEKLANSTVNDDPGLMAQFRQNLALLAQLQPGEVVLPGGQVVHIEEVDDRFDLLRLFQDHPRGS